MLDGEMAKEIVVWGFPVPITPSGRRKWPKALRTKVAERIASGAGVSQIAEEIDANVSLVAKWARSIKVEKPAPSFIEAIPPDPVTFKREIDVCRIRIGDTEISIQPGYPRDHLIDVLRAVKSAQ